MSAFDEIEENIRLREQKIKARELEVRLKEIEQELDNIPVQPTTKHVETVATGRKKRPLNKRMADIGKFCLIVISVIVAVRVAAWLSTVLIVLGVIWMAYKLFLDSD